MVKVDIGSAIADFDTRAPGVVGNVVLASNRSHLFYVRPTVAGTLNPDAYLLMLVGYAVPGPDVKSPLLCKYFFDGIEMVYLVPVPRVRDTNNQNVIVGFLPREFYRNRAPVRQVDVTIAYEDDRDFPLAATFPGS